jgi:predicted DCC family thiol-disulfide oxidoreductase YuxK
MSARVHFAPGTAPSRPVVLYDGHCRFCKRQMANLVHLARRDAIEPLSFQDEGVLERFEGLTYDACMQAMHLVTPEGRVYRGMEAAVRAVVTRPILGAFAWVYYLPGIKQLLDAIYRWIARRRYRIAGRELATEGCEGGTCSVHLDGP